MSSRVALPILAIVGRPNVGKSRLFNRFAGRSRALVRNEPGITRDRIVEELRVFDKRVLIVDTAGLDSAGGDELSNQVQSQVRCAVAEADAILFVVDGQTGLLPEDEEIARALRRTQKPIAIAVNKIDIPAHEPRLAEFHQLGFERIFAISAEHGGGAFELLESLVDALPDAPAVDAECEPSSRLLGPEAQAAEIPDYSEVPLGHDFGEATESLEPQRGDPEPVAISVAVVGRPNVGKSSLVNRLFGEERLVVSDVPGTTRDAIDIDIDVDGTSFTFVDTAGLRRPGRRGKSIERASALMTLRSVERADVALLLVDAAEGFSDQDAHVGNLARERGCATVVLANKWDCVEGEQGENILEGIRHGLRFMLDVPILSVSAQTGARLPRIFPALQKVMTAARRKLGTAELNRWLQETVRRHQPAHARRSGHARRPIKFFYAVQTAVAPPTFVFFCTRPHAVQTSYRRYLENQLRAHFDFEGTPIRLRFRPRTRSKSRD